MASEEAATAIPVTTFKYSKRVLLKTILDRDDGGLGLVGERIVIGGWVKSSKELRKEPQRPSNDEGDLAGPKDVSCVEILQSRIPMFRSILRIFAGTRSNTQEKLDSLVPNPPSTAILQVSDGSCVASLQVLVESSIASPSSVMPTGTCILAEGVMKQPSVLRRRVIEFHVEKILHVGAVDHEKYPLSKKRLPLVMLRDFSHFRPRTTTVASVMRIRSALTFATQTFFQNHGFLNVQVPIITTTDCEGFSEKFYVTPLYGKVVKKEEPSITIEGVTLEGFKAAIKEKNNLIEELKRSESDKEALAAAVQDLQKTNELASELEAREKSRSKADKVSNTEEYFSSESYLTVCGRLHLESYACALGNVYSFGPRFRAVKSDSAKQVAEMWMVELEMAFSDLEDVINCADDYLKFLCKWVFENCPEDMKFVSKRIDTRIVDRLQSMALASLQRISYTEAVDILKNVTDKIFKVKVKWGVALTEEHVRYLVDDMYKSSLIIYNYPKEVKPFYVRLNDDNKTVAAFDLVVPMVGTLITGSQNEERINMLDARIQELGLSRGQCEWYLDLRRHGTVKHSGFSFGFDVMVLLTTGLTDVRDVPVGRSRRHIICFIHWNKAVLYKDVMTDANILQGAIFHEDSEEIGNESDQAETPKRDVENLRKPLETNPKLLKNKLKPAAHQVYDPPVRNSQEAFMMEMRASRMVQAADSILKLVLELKQTAIFSGFISLNDHIEQRTAEFNLQAEKTNSMLARIGEEAAARLKELESHYYASAERSTQLPPAMS